MKSSVMIFPHHPGFSQVHLSYSLLIILIKSLPYYSNLTGHGWYLEIIRLLEFSNYRKAFKIEPCDNGSVMFPIFVWCTSSLPYMTQGSVHFLVSRTRTNYLTFYSSYNVTYRILHCRLFRRQKGDCSVMATYLYEENSGRSELQKGSANPS